MRNPIKLPPPTGVAALLALLLTIPILAQSKQPTANIGDPFANAHREARAKNSEGLEFKIRLAGGKTKFRPREAIGLELKFSSRLSKAYRLGGLQHDRSGRLHDDSFHIDPSDGFVDPLREYFKAGAASSMGGLGLEEDLEEEPYELYYDLNEWIRFDKPGTYRLFVTSPRVYRIPSVMQKDNRAKAISLHTLLENEPELLPKPGVAYLASDFLDLPAELQRSLLSTHWKKVADPGMRFREDTRCYTSMLRSAGSRLRGTEIENLAGEFLDDPETDVVIDAVVALGEYGSAGAEEALWRRLETWNRKWAGRTSELLAPGDEAMESERSLETTFVYGLSHSPAWLMDPGKLDRLKQLCLTRRGQRDIESIRAVETVRSGLQGGRERKDVC